MDLNKLHTFYTLARVKNYSRCAEKLYVTQSAVSHAIKNLEQSLGLILIQKKKNSFSLTGEGEVLFASCRKIFSEVDRARETLLVARDYPEQITLGATVEFGNSVLIRGMESFLRDHPRIHVDFHMSHSLLKPLLDDELDLIVDCRPHNRPELTTIPLFREAYVVVAAPGYIRRKKLKQVSDLEHCRLLSLDKEMVWWQNFSQALDNKKRPRFHRIVRINHIRGMISGALEGMGVAFVPRYTVLGEIQANALEVLFPELDLANDQINIYIKPRHVEMDRFQLLIQHLKQMKFE
ncbi:MAG: LysR family transcriptional regulator [Desulfobacterales bacterium]|nr:LysR family transcriptional regulator [Desulfobacterales bacterium]